MIERALFLVSSFLLGAIPFGYIIARLKGIDITQHGSGNIGATNVMRVLGTTIGTAVFVLDILKGFIPAFVAAQVFEDRPFGFAVGIAAVVGHSFSPFLKFKGGKGIATGLGTLLGSSLAVGLGGFSVFLICMACTFTVSISSIVGTISLTLIGLVLKEPIPLMIGYVAMGVFAVVKHKSNLERVRAGTEPKFLSRDGAPPVNLPVKRAVALVFGLALAYVVLRIGVIQSP